MADDNVTQQFTADVEQYVGPVEEMRAAVDELRDALLEAAHETHGLRDGLAEMAGATDGNTMAMAELRDKLAEVALAADAAKHEINGVRDAELEAGAAADAESGSGFLGGLGGFLSKAGGVLTSMPVIIGAIVAAVAALLPEVAGLLAGFTAAGLGVGSFALLALGAFDKIKNGYTSVTAAQQAYHAAVQLEQRDPTKANAQAVATALDKLKIAWGNLSPAARQGVHGIDELKDAYGRMVKAFTPDAMKVFDDGLKLANELLPQIKPFADTAATALGNMLKAVAAYFEPAKQAVPVTENMSSAAQRLGINVSQQLTPWQQFTQYMHSLEGPALSAIGSGMGHIGTNLGKLLTVMSKKDVINAINIGFTILSGTVHILTDAIRWTMDAYDDLVRAFKWVRREIDDTDSSIRHSIDTFDRYRDDVIAAVEKAGEAVGQFAMGIYRDVNGWIDRTLADVAARWDQGWSAVVSFVRGVPAKIVAALGNIGGLLVDAGSALIHGLIGGIESAIPGLEGVIAHIRSLVGDVLGLIGHAVGAASSAGGGGAHAGLAAMAAPAPVHAAVAAAAAPQQISVRVDLANVMSHPAALQAFARHMQEAAGDFASRASGSFLVLPGKHAGI